MKTIPEGYVLEFLPESWSEEWVTGRYVSPVPDRRGWHYVKWMAHGGDQYMVPTRRIRVRA